MVAIMSNEDKFSWNRIRRRLSRSKSLTYIARPEHTTMPTCVPVSNNHVTDVNANKPPAPNNDSKLHRIMACLFWKKKTDVVDMKKDSVLKKQKLTVDRSERSRRVLKMESMREAPTTRDESDKDPGPQAAATKQMFLPSENPTASFLSYLNPSVRRACSDVIKTSTDNMKPKSKEAFVQDARPVRTRNTNYRGQRATDREPIGTNSLGRPPKLPIRSQSHTTHAPKKPIVVPGIMGGSEDDVGYNSDNDIDDLHEEMRRMNISHPDLRTAHVPNKTRHRRREGSISVSEESDTDIEDVGKVDPSRPQNPAPEEVPAERFTDHRQSSSRETTPNDTEGLHGKASGGKRKSMEQVIDALFQQTQCNLDHIYQNGLEQLEEIETYRGETATPETAMRRLDEQLGVSSDDDEPTPNTNGAFVNRKTGVPTNTPRKPNKVSFAKTNQENEMLEEYTPEMDGLLTEVSAWAKDRQTWLLNPETQGNLGGREETSISFNDKVIDHVTRSNDDKCTEWVETQNKEIGETTGNADNKLNGMLTGPKLFRSTSRNQYSSRVSLNSEKDANQLKDQSLNEENIDAFESNTKSVNNNINRNGLLIGNAPNIVHLGSLPGFGRQSEQSRNEVDNLSLMYCDDRSTIDDNLSDIEQSPNYQARSPDSWMSSVVSYPNRANHAVDTHNDSFEGTIPSSHGYRDSKQPSPTKRSASSPAKSHQIVRIAPKIYSPFKNVDKPKSFVGESKSFSGINKPMIRNTQLRPLPASRPPRPMEMLNQMSGLETLSTNSFNGASGRDVYRGSRNMLNELNAKNTIAEASPRPYSEIPLRSTSLTTYDNVTTHNSPPSESHHYNPRPNSETIPVKKIDKIGTGRVMATDTTRERNKYARDIVNSFQTHRLQPQSAFGEISNEDKEESNKGNEETKHKRHTVFDNNLLKGGYTYDKHSRTRSRSRDTSATRASQENQHGQPVETNASVSQLHISVSDSSESAHMLGNTGNVNTTYGDQGQGHDEAGMTMGGKTFQSHTHGVTGNVDLSKHEDMSKTAAKFKRLRSRRDQEMEWLMKDAAETEV